MLLDYKLGQSSIILRVKLQNSSVSTGAGLTGLTYNSSGLIISTIADNEASPTVYSVAGSTIETISTLGTYATPTSTKCRFKEVDATNHKGVYEVHIADARFAVSNAKFLLISFSGATNLAERDVVIPLRQVDLYDSVRGGMTALPNVASGSAGGVIVQGTGTTGLNVASGKAPATIAAGDMATDSITGSSVKADAASKIAVAVRDVDNGDGDAAVGSLGETVYVGMITAAEASGYAQNIIAKLGAFTGSGINTVLGFMKALMRSDASAPSDLGGTYSPATMSVEAASADLDTITTQTSAAATRTAVGLGSANLDTQLSSIYTSVGLVPAAVWAVGTRTLTGFGTLVADIWSYATRVLTAGTNLSIPSTSDIATALFVDGGTNKLKVNADHSVNATATVDEEAIADAVVASLTASGVTVDDASIDLISAAVAATLATVHNLNVVQPSVDRSTISLVIGDDYYNADGRAVRIAIPGTPPDLTGASCVLRLDQDDDEDPGVTGTIYESGGTSYCRFDLPSTYTAEVNEGGQTYNVIVTLSNNHELTPIIGRLVATSRV